MSNESNTDNSLNEKNSLIYNGLGSATTGFFVRIPFFPLDTCKAKLQVQQKYLQKGLKSALLQSSTSDPHQQSKYLPNIRNIPLVGRIVAGTGQFSSDKPFRNTWDTLLRTFNREGIVGLYRGFSVAAIGSIPAVGIYFTTYEATRRYLKETSWVKSTYISDFIAGFMAEAVSCVLFVPIDVIKERMQVQSNVEPMFRYRNTRHAIGVMLTKEGSRGLFRAYGATLASFGPYSGLSLMLYEGFKEFYCKTYDISNKEISAFMITVCACGGGGIAGFLTNPLDTVKVRMQVQRGGIYHFGYHNILHGLGRLLREESIRSLWVGAGARVAYVMPYTAFNIALYESFTRWYREHLTL